MLQILLRFLRTIIPLECPAFLPYVILLPLRVQVQNIITRAWHVVLVGQELINILIVPLRGQQVLGAHLRWTQPSYTFRWVASLLNPK